MTTASPAGAAPTPAPIARDRMAPLTIGIIASAALHLFVAYRGPGWLIYVFKPLTTTLLFALAATTPGEARRYRAAILAGLAFSLGGDVSLILPGDYFIPGLASFLCAHLCYIAAFIMTAGFRLHLRVAAPYAIYLVALMAVLLPHLGPLLIPVVLYGVVICLMGAEAMERWMALRTRPSSLAAIGAALFIASDSMLAIGRFIRPFGGSPILVMSTYVAAQWLIARSIADPSRAGARAARTSST